RARHAASRTVAQRIVGGERLWPPGSRHFGDGRAAGGAQHPVGRRALAAVLAVRTGLVRRPDRPRRRTSDRKMDPWIFPRGWHAGALPRTGAGEGSPARGAPG